MIFSLMLIIINFLRILSGLSLVDELKYIDIGAKNNTESIIATKPINKELKIIIFQGNFSTINAINYTNIFDVINSIIKDDLNYKMAILNPNFRHIGYYHAQNIYTLWITE